MKRKSVVIGLSYLCGLFIAAFLSLKSALILMPIAALCMLFLVAIFPGKVKHIALCTAAFCLAIGIFLVYTVDVYRNIISYAGKQITFTGVVTDFSHLSGDRVSFTLVGELDGHNTTMSLVTNDTGKSFQYCDTVTVSLIPEEISDTIYFTAEEFYKPRGVFLGGYCTIESVEKSGFSLKKSMLLYRDYLNEIITTILPDGNGGFIAAMLCGDKSLLSESYEVTVRRVGMTHIFSVSGLHLVIIVSAVIKLLKLLRLNRYAKFAISEVFILAFVMFAGGAVPVVRAAVMMTLANLAPLLRRRYDSLTAIIICVVSFTIANPFAVRDSSLLLSAMGAFSIGTLTPKVVKALNLKHKFYKLKFAFIASLTLSATLLPLSIMFFDEVSIVSFISNTFLLPICTLPLCLSAIVALTGGTALIAKPLLYISSLAVKLFMLGAEFLSKLPFATAPTGYKSVKLAGIICIAIAFAVIIIRRKSDALTISVSAISYLCFIFATYLNSYLLADTIRIYSMRDGDDAMLVITQGKEYVLVNMSGSGAVAEAVPALMESKGISKISEFYDLADSTTALAIAKSLYCYYGNGASFADISCDGNKMDVVVSDDIRITISLEALYSENCDYSITSEYFSVSETGEIYYLFGDIDLVKIDDSGATLRMLDYNYDE